MNSKRLLVAVMLFMSTSAFAQPQENEKSMDIYGFVMTDAGYNFNQINSDWFDVVRPTKLPSFKDEYGPDGNAYFSVRQTRFGVKGYTPTKLGLLKTQFEFEMFGTGVDAGQTTIRLRHAYGELGKWGVGQYWSPFMDIDVFPNSLEYWGPSGMAFFRNVQIRYMPIQGDTRLTLALERPGASAETGEYEGRIELQNVKGRFKLPDFSAEYRRAISKGYVEIAGILRSIGWEDMNQDSVDLSGDALGWGVNLSTNLSFGSNNVFRGQVVYGSGIQNYMNDATADIGVKTNNDGSIEGVALPCLGIVAFLDHKWNDRFSSSIGYSSVTITNEEKVAPETFKSGQYALANLLYYPAENMMCGVEMQWGQRQNEDKNPDTGFDGSDILKVQFSFKYNFSQSLYRK